MDYQALANELTTDPLVRGYIGMTDQQAADDLNTLYRPADGGVDGMIAYCITHKNRTNLGSDLVGSAIMGRLHHVAESAEGSDPFGQGGGFTLDLEGKHAAQAFVDLLLSPQINTVNFIDTEIDNFYTHCVTAGVWKTADVDALKALSQNQQSRAQELGLGRVGEGDVAVARAL